MVVGCGRAFLHLSSNFPTHGNSVFDKPKGSVPHSSVGNTRRRNTVHRFQSDFGGFRPSSCDIGIRLHPTSAWMRCFGVLLGYFYHFRPSVLEGVMRGTASRLAIAVLSLFLLSFAYFFPFEHPNYMFSTIGFTFIYLGFGGVLLLSLYVHGILPRGAAWVAEKMGNLFAFAGIYSYSIYLWHGPIGAWFPGLMRHTLHFPTSRIGSFTSLLHR